MSFPLDDDHRVVLEPISGRVNCEHEYINASYVDVRPSTQHAIHSYMSLVYYYIQCTGLFSTQEVCCHPRWASNNLDIQMVSVWILWPFVGPLPKTVTDFWWLVWQEGIPLVAMVTNLVEGGQQKCEQYWPDQGIQEYGLFKVTLTDQQVFADYTIRQLLVAVSLITLDLFRFIS